MASSLSLGNGEAGWVRGHSTAQISKPRLTQHVEPHSVLYALGFGAALNKSRVIRITQESASRTTA